MKDAKAQEKRQDMNVIKFPIFLFDKIKIMSKQFRFVAFFRKGLFISEVETILETLCHKNVVGFDVVETASDRLGDNTAVVAAKIIYDFLTLIE